MKQNQQAKQKPSKPNKHYNNTQKFIMCQLNSRIIQTVVERHETRNRDTKWVLLTYYTRMLKILNVNYHWKVYQKGRLFDMISDYIHNIKYKFWKGVHW